MLFNQFNRIDVDCFGRFERFFFDFPCQVMEEEDEEESEEEGESAPLFMIRLSLEEVTGADVEREEGEDGEDWLIYLSSWSFSSDVWEYDREYL